MSGKKNKHLEPVGRCENGLRDVTKVKKEKPLFRLLFLKGHKDPSIEIAEVDEVDFGEVKYRIEHKQHRRDFYRPPAAVEHQCPGNREIRAIAGKGTDGEIGRDEIL